MRDHRAIRFVTGGAGAGHGAQLHRLLTGAVSLAERKPVGDVGYGVAVEIDQEFVAALRVEALWARDPLSVGRAGGVRAGGRVVHIHHEDDADLAAEDVEVVDVQAVVRERRWRIEVMRHSLPLMGVAPWARWTASFSLRSS